MMIGPGGYVAENIDGKTREEAQNEIESLWEEIRRLRVLIEDEVQSDEMLYHPTPGVKISVYHDYLAAAKEYFVSQGWEYDLAEEEKRDQEFNERIELINSIEIEYGGYLCGGERRKVSFDGEEIKCERMLMPYPSDPAVLNSTFYEDMNKAELLEELCEIHMGEWDHEYVNLNVLDGIQWSVTINYADDTKRTYEGSNKYPYNFDRFLDVMQMEPIED